MDVAFLGLEDPALVASLRHGPLCSGTSAAWPVLIYIICQRQPKYPQDEFRTV